MLNTPAKKKLYPLINKLIPKEYQKQFQELMLAPVDPKSQVIYIDKSDLQCRKEHTFTYIYFHVYVIIISIL